MRNAFADELTQLSRTDPRVVLLAGDIGNRLFDNFKDVDESRFINCGVAEANMMGVAAGMAMNGLRPFVYSIAPFITTRCLEQIRVDICYHNVPVVIVGTGSGLSYANLGPTHHSLEDIAILRALPGMRVFAPCDSIELRLILRDILKDEAPAYIRIGKKGEPDIHTELPDFSLGKAVIVRPGEDIAIMCAGNMMTEVLKTVDILSRQGVSVEVTSFHTIKPLDDHYLRQAASRFRQLITVEEHGCIGGFGSAVAEWRVTEAVSTPQLMFGTGDEFMHEVGDQSYARGKFGLTADNMAGAIQAALSKV